MRNDKNAPFAIERRGYNRFEVEHKVSMLEGEIVRLENELSSLKNQLATVMLEKSELENKQSLIEATLINAEIAAREIVQRAESNAMSYREKQLADLERIDKRYADKKAELLELTKRVEYVLKSQLALVEANKDELER